MIPKYHMYPHPHTDATLLSLPIITFCNSPFNKIINVGNGIGQQSPIEFISSCNKIGVFFKIVQITVEYLVRITIKANSLNSSFIPPINSSSKLISSQYPISN